MKNWFIVLLIPLFVSSCVTLPKSSYREGKEIVTGPGPEDMVVDTITEIPRILISCNERRAGQPYYGEIEAFYPSNGERKILKRFNEPNDLQFKPHGIDLVQLEEKNQIETKDLILLVVNHEKEQKLNSILRYRVTKEGLYFLSKTVSPLISSPNAVAGLTDGTFLVSNDAKKAGNFWEPLLKLKRAEIAYCNNDSCSVATGKFCYTNGITVRNGKVYLASTRQGKVWSFDFDNGKMINKRVVAKVMGGDNLRFDGDDLLVVCHLRFMAFLKHMKDKTKFSPTTVYRIHTTEKKTSVEFFDDGSHLSAGSTAIVFGDKLYVCGVFDAHILQVPLSRK